VALGHDLHVLRLMVPASASASAPAAPSSSSSSSSSAGADKGDEAGNGHSHGGHGGHGGALSAKYVVEQLPNTVSVSFRGLSVAQAMPALQVSPI